MTYGYVQRATKRLKLHPYRLQVCHELNLLKPNGNCIYQLLRQLFTLHFAFMAIVWFPI
jgi:hypothetical protein